MDRYVCIHGHFYQPPRENPWLEAIEQQDSAYPYHDWNERITAECYGPNAAARILDGENRIVDIVNNYARISFNFGPTLLSWMETNAPHVYEAIREADRDSQRRFGGHGSAIAQVYNHLIMPLANDRDRLTQVRWGIADFRHRFGRAPEGMWLAETAVDVQSLELLAEEKIAFTILSPYQARRVRELATDEWEDVVGGKVDPTQPYQVCLPSGKSIAVFFYDGPISRAVAFDGLLHNGETFANRLIGAFTEDSTRPQLVHVATDGETYGHHQRYGEMALAYALEHIESNQLAQLTNYGEYLEKFPPTHEVEIVENSSWSCFHGVERWRSNCGCHTGGHAGWTQEWRGPLRQSLRRLRDAIAPQFEAQGGELFEDPWKARDAYISVILNRSPENVSHFLDRHARHPLNDEQITQALKLLEMQRQAMLMFTSCGWFFSELSGIETVQVIQYAGRVVQLAEELFGDHVESRFLELLARAKSNLAEHQNGARIYERSARAARVDLKRVAAHFAVSSLFSPQETPAQVYCYDVELEEYQQFEAGRAGGAVGRVRINSSITRESEQLVFAVVHFGDHNLSVGVRVFRGAHALKTLVDEMRQAFQQADLPAALRTLDRNFGAETYSLKSLFQDERRAVVRALMAPTVAQAEEQFRTVYETQQPLMRFIADLGAPLPTALRFAGEVTVNHALREAIEHEPPDWDRVNDLLTEATSTRVPLDSVGLGHALQQAIERTIYRVGAHPLALEPLDELERAVTLMRSLEFQVDLWDAQNAYWDLLGSALPEALARGKAGDETSRRWSDRFLSLGELLSVRAPV
jgi:alpha-amylase/alpha-mannosidase (GH57 family)